MVLNALWVAFCGKNMILIILRKYFARIYCVKYYTPSCFPTTCKKSISRIIFCLVLLVRPDLPCVYVQHGRGFGHASDIPPIHLKMLKMPLFIVSSGHQWNNWLYPGLIPNLFRSCIWFSPLRLAKNRPIFHTFS